MRLCTAHISLVTVISFALHNVNALFEDQVGKFDWRLENIGKVSHAIFDPSSKFKQILVGSEDNVVASISTTTGQIVWRHVMEESSPLYHMFYHESSVYTITRSHVRKWNVQHGFITWEAAYPDSITQNAFAQIGNSLILAIGQDVVALSLSSGQELWSLVGQWKTFDQIFLSASNDMAYLSVLAGSQVTVYIIKDELAKQHSQATLPTADSVTCKNSAEWLICHESLGNSVYSLYMANPSSKIYTFSAKSEGMVRSMSMHEGGVLLIQLQTEGLIYRLGQTSAELVLEYSGVGSITHTADGSEILLAISQAQEKKLEVRGFSVKDGRELVSYTQALHVTVSAPPAKIVPLIYNKVGGSESYRMLVIFEDLTLSLLQQSGLALWLREEGLSSIAALEMVDLPVSEVQAQMEEEFGAHSSGGLLRQFFSRLVSQFQQLSSFIIHSYHKYIVGLRVIIETEDHTSLDEDYLTRDEFNLHKMIVAVSRTGKVYGLDSYTGKVVWSRYIPQLAPFPSGNRLLLFIQRTTAHFPHPAYATVIGQHKTCQKCGSLLYSFNPITGEAYTSTALSLNYSLDQVSLLPTMQSDFVKPLLMLDTAQQVHVYPADAKLPGSHQYYLYSAQIASGSMVGFRVAGESLQTMVAIPTWRLSLKEPIVSLRGKLWRENVHSLGKVMSDRSVLYKYSNPNLVSIITEKNANTDTSSLNVYLLDSVSGRVIFSCEHKKSSSPVHMVHSENWIVYSYYNTKNRRVEIAVLELYEGSVQSNSTAFSSLESNTYPIVMRQAYILGTSVSALSTTLTERGITGKDIIIARTVGGIVEVPKLLLDPRRPQTPTAESREEGLTPYMPELPLSYEWTINYNQTVYRIQDIHAEPAGLESTCLVVAYGLDVFHTRVAPSKMYDVLKDDFDYLFIGAVTVGMILISFVTKHFAQRKMVKRAWN